MRATLRRAPASFSVFLPDDSLEFFSLKKANYHAYGTVDSSIEVGVAKVPYLEASMLPGTSSVAS